MPPPAVILSGTGSDGTLGIKDIKAGEGLVLVQSEETAAYDGMPRSAINTGLVDMVLPPGEMPVKLVQYFRHPGQQAATPVSEQQQWLNKVYAILRTQVGHDFSSYKADTILRRIDRRMGLNQIDSHATYARFMRENPEEVSALFREGLFYRIRKEVRDLVVFSVYEPVSNPGQQMEDIQTSGGPPGPAPVHRFSERAFDSGA